jgi:hypothetical protein
VGWSIGGEGRTTRENIEGKKRTIRGGRGDKIKI